MRRALDERPEKLDEPAFRDELLDLVRCYALRQQAGAAPARGGPRVRTR